MFTYFGDDDRLFENLDGIEITSALLATHDHLTKSPLPENFKEFKVLQSLPNY